MTKNLKINFIWNSIGSFTYLFCQWLLTFLIIQLSDNLTDAGNLSLAISITNIFFNIACFNVRPYLVSDDTNEYKVEEYITFRIITIFFSLVACFIYTLLFKYNTTQIICISLYMIFKIGEAIVDLFHAFEQRKSRMDIGGISLLIRGILSIFLFSIGMILFHNMNIAILLMIIATYLFIFIYDFSNVKKFENLKVNFKSDKIKELFFKFLPLAIGTFLGNLSTTFPRQVLERLYSTDTLGIYGTVATPAVIVNAAASYIYNPLLVSFSNYRTTKNYKSFFKLFINSLLVISAFSILCYIGSLLLAEPVLNILYTSKISKYHNLFNIIIIYTSLSSLFFFFQNILIIFRKIKTILIINLSGFLICIITSKLFIEKYKLNGVSYTLILFTFIMIIEIFITINKCMKKLKKDCLK